MAFVAPEKLQLLDGLLMAAPVGLGVVDREFRFVQINPALAAINGGPVEDHLGLTVAESVPDLWPELEPLYRGVLERGEPATHMETLGGRHLLASMFPVRIGGRLSLPGWS